MDHPAIAKVFDAGSTPEGRPYFVMEYVSGLPITDYCDKHKLTIRQWLGWRSIWRVTSLLRFEGDEYRHRVRAAKLAAAIVNVEFETLWSAD